MKQTLFVAIAVGLLAFGTAAQAPDDAAGFKQPKSGAAKRALLKRDRALGQAEDDYREAVGEANKVLLAELKKAQEAAFASKNLEEVNAVAELVRRTERELKSGDPAAAPRLDGRWDVVFGSGDVRTYVFKGADYSMKQGDFAVDGTLRKTKSGLVHDEGNGKLNRITVLVDRFFIEHFINPQADFPAGRPNNVGVGLRAR